MSKLSECYKSTDMNPMMNFLPFDDRYKKPACTKYDSSSVNIQPISKEKEEVYRVNRRYNNINNIDMNNIEKDYRNGIHNMEHNDNQDDNIMNSFLPRSITMPVTTMSLERVGTDYSEGISRDGSTQVSKHSPLVRDLSHSRFNLQGNLTNLRINNTKALYSSNFTPNFPLASIPGTSLLLLTQKNAPFADSSGNNVTVTVTPVGTPFPQVTSASPSSYPK